MAVVVDPAEHFSKWLARFSGCHFAARYATREDEERLRISVVHHLPDDQIDSLNRLLEGCAEIKQAGIFLFPGVGDQEQLVAIVQKLASSDRWELETSLDEARGMLVRLLWRTADGHMSDTLGMAPLLTMPLTRRAPYCAIALWPGSPRKEGEDRVGFIDMPSGLPADKHRQMLQSSTDTVRNLLGEEPKEAPWRNVTFCLEPWTKRLF